MLLSFVVLLLTISIVTVYSVSPNNVTSIAFGSCNKHNFSQPLWDQIGSPDAWVWLGDVVYADTRTGFGQFIPSPIEHVTEVYSAQLKQPKYKRFIDNNPEMDVLGVWDDHDFGVNDGDVHFPNKDAIQQIFLDFLNVPLESPRRARRGTYNSKIIIDPASRKKTQIILLDNRYFLDYDKGVILGDEQWSWLEEQLNVVVDFRLIGGGIQFLIDDRNLAVKGWSSVRFESWGVIENERSRLLGLVVSHSSSTPVIFISGDIHLGELAIVQCGNSKLVDVTSSGMTHSWQQSITNVLSGRDFFHIGDPQPGWENLIGQLLFRTMIWIAPGRGSSEIYSGLNFGNILIDWETETVRVTVGNNFPMEENIDRVFSFPELQHDGTICWANLSVYRASLWILRFFFVLFLCTAVIVLLSTVLFRLSELCFHSPLRKQKQN